VKSEVRNLRHRVCRNCGSDKKAKTMEVEMETNRNRSKRVLVVGALAGLAAVAVSVPLLAEADNNRTAMVATTQEGELTSGQLRVGVYDPYGSFSQDSRVKIEHVYIPWEDVDLASLDRADKYARERGRELLLTVEPWTWSKGHPRSPEALWAGIMAGEFEANIRDICTKAAGLKSSTTIRWGHEMDIANKRYPWSQWKPEQYVAAYRHFVDSCRHYAPTAAFMWSPRGEATLSDYYPGDRYVDVVGISLFGLQQYDRDVYGRDRTVVERFKETYARVAKYHKDIIIAEFGCEGERRYKEECLEDLFQPAARAEFPELKSVVYFNEKESFPWSAKYGLPDWRLTPNQPKSFAQTKRQ